MLRDCLAMVVAFAVSLFALEPNAGAQFTPAPDPQAQQAPQYPSVSQDGNGAPPADAQGQAPDPNQPAPTTTPEQDEAADRQHGVARLSIIQGDVNVKRGDSGDLTAAVVNAPLLTGDHLQTGEGSRAEIELDAANLVRVAPDTEVIMADLEYHRYGIQLASGTVVYRVLRASDAQREVDTPSIGFRPLGEGEFRLSVLSDGTTQITARSGQAEIFGPRGSQSVPAGETVLVRGNSGDPEFRNVAEIGRDQFDDWNERRDAQLQASRSYQYVSPDVQGAGDLDQYGQWVPSQYGQVWTPQNEPADWSPYSTGQWAWQDYYGWTWVDSAPWGWAPYHYGRWFHNGGYGWCWWPGAVGAAFWSPALVGFFGWGGFGVGLALGGLGWCALAPFEGFHRWWGPGWYGRGFGYGGGYGWGGGRGFRPYVVNNVNVRNVYRNAAFRGGAITARYNGFGGPHQSFSPATRGQLSNASAFRGGAVPIAPNRTSYRFSDRSVAANARLSAASNQRFFQSAQFRQSAPANRAGTGGFASRGGVSGPAYNSGANARPGAAPSQGHGVAPNLQQRSFGQNSYAGRATPNTGRSSSNGWQRFGDPGNGSSLRQGFNGGGSGVEQGGWHHFGQPRPGSAAAPSYGGSNSYRAPAAGATRSYAPAYGTGRSGASGYNAQPHYSAPSYNAQPRYSAPGGGSAQPRYNAAPSYSAPRSYSPPRSYSAPGFSSSSPHYSAPQSSAPRYSSPSGGRSFGGGGGGSSFHGSGGGGGARSNGGGGGHSSGGGGGHSGGGGHHR